MLIPWEKAAILRDPNRGSIAVEALTNAALEPLTMICCSPRLECSSLSKLDPAKHKGAGQREINSIYED